MGGGNFKCLAQHIRVILVFVCTYCVCVQPRERNWNRQNRDGSGSSAGAAQQQQFRSVGGGGGVCNTFTFGSRGPPSHPSNPPTLLNQPCSGQERYDFFQKNYHTHTPTPGPRAHSSCTPTTKYHHPRPTQRALHTRGGGDGKQQRPLLYIPATGTEGAGCCCGPPPRRSRPTGSPGEPASAKGALRPGPAGEDAAPCLGPATPGGLRRRSWARRGGRRNTNRIEEEFCMVR